MADDETQLLFVHQIQQPGREHDEWAVHSDGVGVGVGALDDVQLRDLRSVQNAGTVVEGVVQRAELTVVGPDRGRQIHQPVLAFPQQRCQCFEDAIESLETTKRLQCGPVGRVFPGSGADPRKLGVGAIGQIGHDIQPIWWPGGRCGAGGIVDAGTC
ncbi:Uncharacterised protein [Mycobacteroides abscessus subsp. abscessus]|nr:Uncharacterised protein [Mycobacteroides abscessus subsp. abscessus]